VVRVAQVGIALGLLGIVITLIGLFPGVIAIPPTPGFGVAQIFIVVIGFVTLISGTLMYVKFTFYAFKKHTLLQQIGIRLAYTGLTFATLAALADVLGFGSNVTLAGEDVLLGPLQLTGSMVNYGVSVLGVLIYAVTGHPELNGE